MVPAIALLLLLFALAANWKTRRRALIAVAIGAFVLAGLFSALVTGPVQAELLATPFADMVDPDLVALAARWYTLDLVSWALALVPGVLLMVATFTSPAAPSRLGGPSTE